MSFSWEAVPSVIARRIAVAARLDSRRAVVSLARAYGATPDVTFVSATWPALRAEWLSRDRTSAKALTEALRARNLGSTNLPVRNHEQRLAYLATCRNTKTLRELALAQFLTAHQASDPEHVSRTRAVTSERPISSSTPDPAAGSTGPSTPEQMFDQASAMLRSMTPELVPALVASWCGGMAVMLKGIHKVGPDEVGRAIAHNVVAASVFVPRMATGDFAPDVMRERFASGAVPAGVAEMAGRVASGVNKAMSLGDLRGIVEMLERPSQGAFSLDLVRQLDPPLLTMYVVGMVASSAADQFVHPDEVGAFVDWVLTLRPAAVKGGDPRSPVQEEANAREQLHPVVAEALAIPREPEWLDPLVGGGAWWASSAGPTIVVEGPVVKTADFEVMAVRVESIVLPERVSAEPQLLAALSELNVREGVNAVVLVDDSLRIRSSIAVHDAIRGWVSPFVGVAMMSSATTALHLPVELRARPVGGSEGVRTVPSGYVADYAGWGVPPEDAAKYRLPTRAEIADAIGAIPGMVTGRTIGPHEVEVRLPGPNGRLERFLGRRRGRSDDQLLVVSNVTRPPWGVAMKFVLRLGTGLSALDNHRLAAEVNRAEWDMAPNVNVWGGWSGEPGGIRMTAVVPQMLFGATPEAGRAHVMNMTIWTAARGIAVATTFGLD